MITKSLRIDHLSDAEHRTCLACLAALDARDVDAYGEHPAAGVSMRLGNADPVAGRDAAKEMLAGCWQSLAGIEHDLVNVYGTDRAHALEADSHDLRHDGGRVTVRAVPFTDEDKAGHVASPRSYGNTPAVAA